MTRRIVILGNGVAGITAAMTARDRDDEAEITVVSGESDYFFSRTALMYAFMGALARRDMEPFERKVYRQRRIALARDEAVDLDARARVVRLRGGASLPWDALLVATGSRPRALTAPGLDDTLGGVVRFVSLRDLDDCERWTPSTREAVVVGGGLVGIELVECLVHHGVKTTFLVREPWYWPVALCREEAALVADAMRAHGVDLRPGDALASAARDEAGRVRAVTTTSGAELACQMLGVCVGVEPAVDFLRGAATPPAIGRGVRVDRQLRTSLEGVWAAGDCAELVREGEAPVVESIWYTAKRQGALAGRNMTGAKAAYEAPVFYNSAKLFELEYTTVGAFPEGARSLFRRHPSRPVTQRIAHVDGRVVGFNMLGSRWDHGLLARWVEEGKGLAWTLEHLHRAQFDVEFGRVDLRAMREEELALARASQGAA